MTQVEHVLTIGNKLGEGPLWHPEEKILYWVDIEEECFHRYYPETKKIETFEIGQPIGCLAFRDHGGLLMALRDGFGSWNWDTNKVEIITNPEADRVGARFNDGKVDRKGRFWAGTLGEDDQSALYRLDLDRTVHTMATGISISNGIGWSPDDKIMYYTDSPLGVIYAYDFDLNTGSISNRREFVNVPALDGYPDGLTVDSEGFVWSAHWDGWRITRYDPEGKVERVIRMPIQRPTSCTFGGPGLDHLYITSAWTGLNDTDRREQPLAGDLFQIQTDIIGKEENLFSE